MLQNFLEYLELCKKICDKRVLQLIDHGMIVSEQSMDSSDDQNIQTMPELKPNELQIRNEYDMVEYFFFPGLVIKRKQESTYCRKKNIPTLLDGL